MKVGEAFCTSYFRAEGKSGYAGYKAPVGEYFVLLLLGTVSRQPEKPFDVDAALVELGWRPCDSGRHPEGEDPKGLSGEAMPERPNADSASPILPNPCDHP